MALAHLDRLIDSVQRNCHVTDARYARGMTLCTYLLEMREFYRWESGIAPGEAMDRAEVGQWLTAREALWESLEGADFSAVALDDELFDPFDAVAINRRLLPEGLIYGAGVGRFHKPHFFLGRLRRETSVAGVSVLVCGCEYARDLTAIPAALQGDTIVVRQESLRQWLWEKAEAWLQKRQDGPMQGALAAYGYFDDLGDSDDRRAALDRMTDGETETLILHEHGEWLAGRELGADWELMLDGMTSRRAELLARAVRDNWADCLSTLPRLIERGAMASLHFWFSTFDGMRRELFPLLVAAYREADGHDAFDGLAHAARTGAAHWQAVANTMLALHRADAGGAERTFEQRTHALADFSL